MALLRRHIIWSLLGNTPTLGSAGHLWFSAATPGAANGAVSATRNGAFISDSSNVPATAWHIIPCKHAETVVIGYASRVVSLVSGDRTSGASVLQGIVVGMGHYDPSDAKFSKPSIARASYAIALHNQAEITGLIPIQNSARATDTSGLVISRSGSGTIVPNSAFVRETAAVPATDDFTDWWFDITKRQSSVRDVIAPTTSAPISRIPVHGLSAIAVAFKTITTWSGGTTDNVINLDAELYANVEGDSRFGQ